MLIGRTLGFYFSRQFVKTIFLVFATVFALVYTLDFVELMRRAGDAPSATTGVIARLALFRTPAIAEQVMPFAVLFGSMAALLQLSRKLELVVARAAGISAWQFLQPGLLIALLIGILSVAVYNPVSAVLKQRASALESSIFSSRAVQTREKPIWIRQKSLDGQAILRGTGSATDSPTLYGVTVYSFDLSGTFSHRVEAREAVLHEGFWELKDARVLSATEEPQSHDRYLIASSLQPSQVRQSFVDPDAVPFWDLKETIERMEQAEINTTTYRLHYDLLLARPLLFIAMVFVAASVSLRFFRFGGVAMMVLGGVAAGFVLYVATELMAELGASGIISSLVAAWFPAVVGSLLGTLALLHQEDG
ncbi:LPS export ABC transporter permease LptG [Microvirga arsenatis]|uniref:LPS export ABC transporter permease LptG n=1 Tax=Microvirga arsenatis TaxID=2692265 RepID=A0ABW9YRY6_9HYPH|nr:LPS export ABC transporter permease LptG [Microvirga arsenatis]NBJ09838.1 LPS export ABC transporter permease LptG [Microvirga arsenatis]NBJ22906.1 LPS export ABC transporter permease LptG [Microvirga arsenatis]